jgi:hypothetical protein
MKFANQLVRKLIEFLMFYRTASAVVPMLAAACSAATLRLAN